MKLKVKRVVFGEHYTFGDFYINDKIYCKTLEDKVREEKIYGKTAIPKGTYKITLRTEGTTDAKYRVKFPKMHKGMLWLRNVPNYEYVLIHTGNTDLDTLGCLLVGMKTDKETGTISESTIAYNYIYPIISKALENNEEVTITIE